MSARHRVVPAFASAPMVACLATIVVTSLHAQTSIAASALQAPAAACSRAEQLLTWNTSPLISGDEVLPTWLPDGNRFWYRSNTAAGAEVVLIDPVRNGTAVSSSGNHDNRSYNIYWSEKYQGLMARDTLRTPAESCFGLNESYVIRRRWDYFVQYLTGATPPDNCEIVRPPDAMGAPGDGAPDDDPSNWR